MSASDRPSVGGAVSGRPGRALTPRNVVFLIVCAVSAVACLRLGVWQLHRLAARRAHNHMVASRLGEPPVPLGAIPRDTATSRYRRVRLQGTFDFADEIILADRVRDGAPGVYLLTPLHPDGVAGDTLVLVNRGWVYAPDGMTVDEAQWREPAAFVGVGYVTPLVTGRGSPTLSAAVSPNEMRWLDRAAIEARLGHPVANYSVVLQPDTTVGEAPAPAPAPTSSAVRTPVRVSPPPLDDGPHLSYAIQWFSFALIALIGPLWGIWIGPTINSRRSPGD